MLVLCDNRTEAFYKAFWSFVTQKVPRLHNTTKYVTCDFEGALIKATKESLPVVQVRGCWMFFIRVSTLRVILSSSEKYTKTIFLFLQAVTRQWRILKLPRRTFQWKTLLGMVWSIPLVPATRIGEAIAAVTDAMAVHATTAVLQKRSQEFLRYLNQFWGRMPETLSVVDHTSCTNYIAERFNKQLLVKLGGRRPPLYSFLSKYVFLLYA